MVVAVNTGVIAGVVVIVCVRLLGLILLIVLRVNVIDRVAIQVSLLV